MSFEIPVAALTLAVCIAVDIVDLLQGHTAQGIGALVAVSIASAWLTYEIVAGRRRKSQAWFWTDEWQAGEREADADIAAGRVTTFESTEAFLAWANDLAPEPPKHPGQRDDPSPTR